MTLCCGIMMMVEGWCQPTLGPGGFISIKNIVWCRPTIEGFKSFLGKKILPSCMLLLTRGNLPGLTWSGRKLDAGTHNVPMGMKWIFGSHFQTFIRHVICHIPFELWQIRILVSWPDIKGKAQKNKTDFYLVNPFRWGGKHYPGIAVSLSTNSIRRQDPNIYSDTETRALSTFMCCRGVSCIIGLAPQV